MAPRFRDHGSRQGRAGFKSFFAGFRRAVRVDPRLFAALIGGGVGPGADPALFWSMGRGASGGGIFAKMKGGVFLPFVSCGDGWRIPFD